MKIDFPFFANTSRKQRIPLAKLAARASRERHISLAQASECETLDRFKLGGNRFLINRAGEFDNNRLTALAISHLGSIFHDMSLGFYLTQDGGYHFLTLKAKAYQYDHSTSLFFPFSSGVELFTLSANIDGEFMGLDDLASRILGKGGEALLALYNLAGEAGVQKISYLVSDRNPRAKLFYSNLGFGEPVAPNSTMWQVNVGKKS